MARFPTPQQIVDAFRAEGLTVVEMPGWRERCRCCAGPHNPNARSYIRGWTDFVGITWHSTYGPRLSGQAAIDYTKRILIAGNGSVPGPLCLAGVDADGRMLMVSAGRANHVGRIGTAALTAMRRASFSTAGNHNLRGAGLDGNQYTLGFEALGSGSPNGIQIDAMVRASAALCRLNQWAGQEVHGHGEVSVDRSFSDPGCDMGAARRAVIARLKTPVAPEKPPVASPKAHPQEDPVPEHRETRTTLTHRGEGWQLPDGKATVATPRAKPMRITASARVTAPIGVTIKTRWVSWSGREWVRYAVTEHATHEVETSTVVGQSAPGADLRLDVWVDKPCAVSIEQSALIWEV